MPSAVCKCRTETRRQSLAREGECWTGWPATGPCPERPPDLRAAPLRHAEGGQGLVGGPGSEQRRPERVAQRCPEHADMTTGDLHAVLLAALGDVREEESPIQRQALDRQ